FALHTPSPRTARLRLTQESRGDSPVELDPPEVRALPRRERTGGPPDVFLYLIDTLRADAVGVYGSPRPTTPNIDRFSSDALVFTRALSPAPWTLPATTSILSGLYPSHHGVIVAGDRLPQTAPWLPALLSRRGFQTLGVSQWLLGGDAFGLDRGFQGFYANVYQNAKTPSANVRWFLWRYLLAPRAAGAGARPPLFAYLHVVDPHALYRPGRQDRAFADEQPGGLTPDLYDPNVFMQQGYGKDPAEVAHLRALYDGEVHAADRQFGAFLEQLRFFDLYEESLIILVGDHGEEFFEHGGFDHGRTLYNELLRVPLIVKLPASWRRTGRVETPVSTLSIAPTVLQVAGQGAGRVTGGPSAGAGFDGPSLTEVARQETPRSAAPLFAETHVEQVNQRAAFLEAVKCILNVSGLDRNAKPAPAFEAFNLTDDPREKKPLALSDHGVLACKRGLEAWMAPKQAPAVEHGALAPEDLAKLRALGYIH
ncbi:MAG TPA: sulfatase, partial [Thermoanaerobaculia bacterium]|nr:sulfatase [Thermoanaerobaculia bacterium]